MEPAKPELRNPDYPSERLLGSVSRILASAPQPRSSFHAFRFYAFTPTAIKILDEEEFGPEVFVLADVVR